MFINKCERAENVLKASEKFCRNNQIVIAFGIVLFSQFYHVLRDFEEFKHISVDEFFIKASEYIKTMFCI